MKKSAIGLILIMLVSLLCSCSEQEQYDSWHLNRMCVDELWECSKGQSQTIAFVDTGIADELAVELAENIVFRYNVLEDNENVTDLHGHGTEMVSVACSNGMKNVWGIAPEAKIMVIKAVADDGKTNNDYLFEALKVADEHGATVVNISLGGFYSDDKVVRQIESMIDRNITVVAAAGDYQNKDLLFPANVEGVISVEASDEGGSLWSDSDHSEDSTVRFPGSNIDVLTVQANGAITKTVASGTSQAAAITSAYVALIRDYFEAQGISYDHNDLTTELTSLATKDEASVNYFAPFDK